jgi:hypothetical protein
VARQARAIPKIAQIREGRMLPGRDDPGLRGVAERAYAAQPQAQRRTALVPFQRTSTPWRRASCTSCAGL